MNRAEAAAARIEALSAGCKVYLTGNPCRNGHTAFKYVSTGGCTTCAVLSAQRRAKANPDEIAAYLKAYTATNIDAHRERGREWKKKNPLAVKVSAKRYRDQDKVKSAASKRHAERSMDPSYVMTRNLRNADWRRKNPSLCLSYVNARRAARMHRTPCWLTDDDHWIMEQAYELAQTRTKMFGFPWHVDHVIPLRGRRVSGLHTPTNLQVIPAVENLKKGNSHG